MRLTIRRPRPDERPRRKAFDQPRLERARRQAWLESSRPRVL